VPQSAVVAAARLAYRDAPSLPVSQSCVPPFFFFLRKTFFFLLPVFAPSITITLRFCLYGFWVFFLIYPSHTRLTAYPFNRKRFRISANAIYNIHTTYTYSSNSNYAPDKIILLSIYIIYINTYIVYSMII